MPTTATVVTPLRFEQGLTYAGFLAQAAVNRDKFEKNYNNPALTDDDLSFFHKAAALAHGPRKLLANRRGMVRRRISRIADRGTHRRSRRA